MQYRTISNLNWPNTTATIYLDTNCVETVREKGCFRNCCHLEDRFDIVWDPLCGNHDDLPAALHAAGEGRGVHQSAQPGPGPATVVIAVVHCVCVVSPSREVTGHLHNFTRTVSCQHRRGNT